MKSKIRTEKRAIHWYEFLPWLFLASALALTYWIWQNEYDAEYVETERVFEQQIDETSHQIIGRLKLFEQSLYSIRKLFDSSEFVSQDEFNQFATEILHSRLSSGVHDIGYAQYVNFNQPSTYAALDAAFIQSVKRLVDQSQLSYAPVIYAVQQGTQATSLPLFNAFADKQLKANMESAALQDEMWVSNGLKLDPQHTSDLVSIILPVYSHDKKQTKVEGGELTGGIRGWVYFNLRLDVVFKYLLGVDENPSIRFALYDGFQENPSTLLYQNTLIGSKPPQFSARYLIDEHGENWVLHASSLSGFEGMLNHKHSTMIAIFGLLGSFSLAGILFLFMLRLRTLESLDRVNKRLKFSDDRWHFAVEGAGHGAWDWDWDWDIRNKKISFSTGWKRMLGFDEACSDEAIGGWRDIVHPEGHWTVLHGYKQALKGYDDHSFECRLRCKDGQWKWVLSRFMIVARGDHREPVRIVGTTTDLSQLKETEEKAWQHANFDSLTGLPNRRMLHAKLGHAIDVAKWQGSKVALLCLDLDDFSAVNDAFGPEKGDVMLEEVAKRLASSIYQYEDVARYSGDEFAILISGIAVNQLSHLDEVAQNVLAMMAAPFMVAGQEVFISASIGIAVYPDDASSVNDLSKNADQALYASTNQGGNCITYFTSEMQEKANKRMQLTSDLRVALRRKDLFVEYQPIVDLKTERVHKAEALLRWQHPERGLISPTEFIPIAESTKLINEIGCWVLAESMAQCKVWRQKINAEFQISVNKSPVQFAESSVEGHDCAQVLAEDAQLRNAIVIEITEGLLLDATGQVNATLEAYKDNGIQVALDDFGTGYSSLAYLQKFDIDYLKIDMSFVRNLEAAAEDRVLCRTIIEMAHGLGMQVIAEGVETIGQRDILLNAGCDYGQGYYFSKSLPPAQFEGYVKKSSVKKKSVK